MACPHPLIKVTAVQQGKITEVLAKDYLLKRGLKFRTNNYRCRCGEIDLIMDDQDCLVFVEVRFRRSNKFGSSSESVNYYKQQRLIHTARYYLQQFRLTEKKACRFDIVAVTYTQSSASFEGLNDANNYQFEWIINAFEG